MKAGRQFILIIASVLLILTAFSAAVLKAPTGNTGKLHIDPGAGNYLYLDRYDLKLSGIDHDGVTWFFLPSYADLSEIELTASSEKIYLSDGSLLNDPDFGRIRDIVVEDASGAEVPWRICFMRSSGLHTVFIDPDDGEPDSISKESFSRASVRSYSESGSLEFREKNCLIKGRGNATWDLGGYSPAKLPYEISFSYPHGLGELPPKKKWVLLANAYEGTGILNKMIFDTAKNMEIDYVTESDWADVYAGSRYLGNYLICSEVQNSASALVDRGGCIIEKNDVYFDEKPEGFKTGHDSFTVKAPSPITPEMLARVKDLTCRVDEGLYLGVPDTSGIDMESFAKWFLLEEFFYNEDALITSCFFYTDHNAGKLLAGPPWDFDGTCGEASGEYMDPTGTILGETEARKPLGWYSRLYDSSPEFQDAVRTSFRKYMPVYKELILSGIGKYYDTVQASMDMDMSLYGRTGYGPDYTIPGYYDSVYNNVRFVRYFLYNRLMYLSELWDVEPGFACDDLTDGTIHTITFTFPDGTATTKEAEDGSVLDPSSLPSYDPEEFDGWYYEANDLPVSVYLPVYEDVTLTLRPVEDSR